MRANPRREPGGPELRPSQLTLRVTPASVSGASLPKLVYFTLELNLHGILAGEYSGDLPFIYKGANSSSPIKITVRHLICPRTPSISPSLFSTYMTRRVSPCVSCVFFMVVFRALSVR